MPEFIFLHGFLVVLDVEQGYVNRLLHVRSVHSCGIFFIRPHRFDLRIIIKLVGFVHINNGDTTSCLPLIAGYPSILCALVNPTFVTSCTYHCLPLLTNSCRLRNGFLLTPFCRPHCGPKHPPVLMLRLDLQNFYLRRITKVLGNFLEGCEVGSSSLAGITKRKECLLNAYWMINLETKQTS